MSLLSQHLVTSIDSIMGLFPQSIFESVDFELEEDHWREIGAGRTAEVVPLRAAKKANGPYFTVFKDSVT